MMAEVTSSQAIRRLEETIRSFNENSTQQFKVLSNMVTAIDRKCDAMTLNHDVLEARIKAAPVYAMRLLRISPVLDRFLVLDQLIRIKQFDTVSDYGTRFREMASLIDGLPEDFLVSCYLGGLRSDELRADVQLYAPATLVKAMRLVRMQEINLESWATNGVKDRISALPDHLLLKILSRLLVVDIIQTGTLSKRWQNLWTFVPNLEFTNHDYLPNYSAEKFVSVINSTLSQWRGSKIDEIYIHFLYDFEFASDVDSWIHFATRNNVEDLYLDLYGGPDVHNLPQHLYTCSSLKELTLCDVEVTPILPIRWSSLTSLSFGSSYFDNEALERIFSGSPLLEYLEFRNYFGLSCLKVTSTSLRELVLSDLLEDDDDGLLAISAPNLRVLRFSGQFHTRNILLEDVSSLVVADLTFSMDMVWDCEKYAKMLQGLFEKLQHVTELKLGTWCIEVLSISKLKGWLSPQLKCNILEVDMHVVKWDLPGIVKLLEMSPYVVTFIISIDRCPQFNFGGHFLAAYDFNEENYLASQDWIPKCLLLHLKNVKILGFQERFLECELVKFLLKNASALEKMVIHKNLWGLKCKSSGCKCDEKLVSAKHMMSFPRSSPHAVVLFPDSQ